MNKLTMKSVDLTQVNIDKIAELFPNVITEARDETGKIKRAIDFDLLKQELSDVLVEGDKERYQLTWPGKREAILNANSPIDKTLRPIREDSVDWDNTQNLFIEGDNLEVLKLLQESYLNKIKLIYIDPPYNTGKDFIYKDNFKESVDEYLEESGQIDEVGNRLFQNTESNGRFHSDWLTMMYSRLKIARNLLREDGFIFISIDENEIDNLKKICNEVFGESNFISCITRATGTPTGGGNNAIVNELDYILVYAKSQANAHIEGLPMSEEDSKIYDMEDEYGKYLIRPLRRTGGEDRREDRPTMFYGIEAPDGSVVYPYGPTGYESRWICGQHKYHELVKENRIEWKKTEKDGEVIWQVYQKFYLENRRKQPSNLWDKIEGNKKATRDCKALFENVKVFDFPKPVELIKTIIQMVANEKNAIILDFFSGSSTTAHAVMQLNAEDGIQRKFIMVQATEPTDQESEAYKAGYKNICEIGKERIRRAAKKIKEETGAEIDYGFRVFRVDSSNMKDVYYTPDKLKQGDMFDLASNIKEDRTGEDLLIQVMLELGLELSLPMETKQLEGKTVHYVAGNSLIACFEDNVPESVIKQIAAEHPLRVVFCDSSFEDDSARINVEELFKMLSPGTEIQVL